VWRPGGNYGDGAANGGAANSGGSFQVGYLLPTDTASGAPAPSGLAYRLITVRHTLTTASLTNPQFWIRIGFYGNNSVAVSGTFQFASPSCRAVQPASQ